MCNIMSHCLKVSWPLYSITFSLSHGVENYFPGLWGTGISDDSFVFLCKRTCSQMYIYLILINSVFLRKKRLLERKKCIEQDTLLFK